MSSNGCKARDCDHMVKIGRAYADHTTFGDWSMVTDGGRSYGAGGLDALRDAAARHCFELQNNGSLEGYAQVTRYYFEVWSLDWSHAPA